MAAYPFEQIEQHWQQHWDEEETFRTPGPGDDGFDPEQPKHYVLDMFPYPSGAGLHVGHPEGYTATDIVARYKRMRGFNVLHPMGWDAFGLPAEQYAIETGTHPRDTTEKNIATFKRQLKALGFSYDWSREVNTTDPDYVRWTQWIFLKLYEKGLAYQAEVPVWWCEALGTVLANEEVIDGKSERGGHPCERVKLRQWMLKITEYAERLLDGLDDLDWPESTKEIQRNWIGRSEGAEVEFGVRGHAEERLPVYTTRPDTLFGATYMVLAPEHPLVPKVTTADHVDDVDAYVRQAAQKSDLQRTELQKEKPGVFTGGFATNPVNGEHVPIWIADYVLATYGTGAIMAVPAHDERDYEFAKKYDLPIRPVIVPEEDADANALIEQGAFTGDGVAVNSDSTGRAIEGIAEEGVSIDGLPVAEAKKKITEWLEQEGRGHAQVNYKLRDWLFSRQRYWGEPFPVIHVDEAPQPLPASALPVELPEVESYDAFEDVMTPLSAVSEWTKTTDPETGKGALRETNTMPQWAGSCWYYLRFLDPGNDEALVDPEKENYWMPVDLYIGGAEHAVLHLLYARFWHKVLYDAGVVSTEEPFQKLVHQGMILGENGEKMSKSRGNVVNPGDIIAEYGADAMRLYEMFMGPLEQVKPWSTQDVEGVYRFLGRVWRLITDDTDSLAEHLHDGEATDEQLRALHRTIEKVTNDIEGLRFNTAIAAMMEFVNAATKWDALPRSVAEDFVLLLSPFAPHLAEELWQRLGRDASLAYAPWPEAVEEYLKEDVIEMAVQVNGTVRGTIDVAADADEETVLEQARTEENVARHLEGKMIRREIYVPGRIINFVAN